jgi:hypothetical protein
MAAEQTFILICDTQEETTITFELPKGSEERVTVRITQAHDLDKTDKRCYSAAARSRRAENRIEGHLNEKQLEVEELQGIMAQLFINTSATWPVKPSGIQKYLHSLRATAQQNFWLELSPEGRREAREAAKLVSGDPKFREVLETLKKYWSTWTQGKKVADRFRQYLRDESAAKSHSVWPLVTEDIYIVTDKERKVVVAVAQELTQLVYDQQATDLLTHALDMWTYFTPIPAPESRRHVVDKYIRKIHPELDLEQQTVEILQPAKQGVAHFGCWTMTGDPHGNQILKIRDTKFAKSYDIDYDFCIDLLPGLFQHVFSKIANVVRFLMEPLDPEYYQDSIDIFNNLPESRKVPTGDGDFNHLFALGINAYTQRHCDTNDVEGGLAGIVTLGQYSGKPIKSSLQVFIQMYLSGKAPNDQQAAICASLNSVYKSSILPAQLPFSVGMGFNIG